MDNRFSRPARRLWTTLAGLLLATGAEGFGELSQRQEALVSRIHDWNVYFSATDRQAELHELKEEGLQAGTTGLLSIVEKKMDRWEEGFWKRIYRREFARMGMELKRELEAAFPRRAPLALESLEEPDRLEPELWERAQRLLKAKKDARLAIRESRRRLEENSAVGPEEKKRIHAALHRIGWEVNGSGNLDAVRRTGDLLRFEDGIRPALIYAVEARPAVPGRRDLKKPPAPVPEPALAPKGRESPLPGRDARLAKVVAAVKRSFPLAWKSVICATYLCALKHGVDPHAALGIAARESGLNPSAISTRKDAAGVQITVAAGAGQLTRIAVDELRRRGKTRLAHEDLLLGGRNPDAVRDNADASVLYYKEMLADFGGDEKRALAAYAYGPTAVKRALTGPERSLTKGMLAYAQKALRYGELFQERTPKDAEASLPACGGFLKTCVPPNNDPGLKVSSPFGLRRHPVTGCSRSHHGVDLCVRGDPGGVHPVTAVYPGLVYGVCRAKCGGYGNHVILRHDDPAGGRPYYTLYAHLHKGSIPRGLTAGSRLAQGEELGRIGSTGRSTGPHLHIEAFTLDPKTKARRRFDLARKAAEAGNPAWTGLVAVTASR